MNIRPGINPTLTSWHPCRAAGEKVAMAEAQQCLQAADLNGAIVALKRTLRLEPSYYQAASQLGMLLHHEG